MTASPPDPAGPDSGSPATDSGPSGRYRIDPTHSHVGFSVRHAMVTTVHGRFTTFSGEVRIDPDVPAQSSTWIDIDVASVDTGVAERDAHLRTGDFFSAADFPTITFRSTGVGRDDDTWRIDGVLIIRDVVRPLSFDAAYLGSAVDPFGNLRAGFEGEVTVHRRDWGLTYNAALEAGGLLISDKVRLSFDISAISLDGRV